MMPNRIKELRLEAGLTLEQLAERIDAAISTVSRLERSERKLTEEWLNRFARALGVSPASLLPNEGQMLPKLGGEFVSDDEELALLHAWRDMTPDQRDILRRLSIAPANKVNDAA